MRKKREVSFPSSVEVTQSPPPPRKKRKRDPSLVMQPAVASTSRAILPPSHQRSRSISSAVTDRQQHPSHAKGKQRAISSDYRATSVLSADQGLPVPANQKGKQRAISTDRHASSAAFSIDGESVMQDEKPFAQKQRSKTRDSTNADSEEPDDFLTPEEAKEFIVLKLSYSELKGIDKAVVWQNLARMVRTLSCVLATPFQSTDTSMEKDSQQTGRVLGTAVQKESFLVPETGRRAIRTANPRTAR